ncbi:MAG: TonB-dependent receptor domain-containing protein [Novosphingobium sp.]
MALSGKIFSRGSSLALALALLMPGAALAQTADDDAADEAKNDTEIVVTGTSLRGEPPVGSSLIQVGRGEIDSSVAVTTTQLVREVPQIFNFGVTDSARNQSGGAGNIVYGNSINIRGLGPFATLTLLNGRRPVGQGTLGASVDPSNIPAIALERVEIIADGASAVYGSDAVAGVANLILRRKYDGLGADVQYGWADDYKEFTANAIFGKDWGSGRFTIAGQHSYRSALSGLARDFYNSNLTALGGADYRVTQCNPGNYQYTVSGVTTNYAIPAGGASASNLIAGTTNRCDNIKVTDILPQQETNSVTFTFDQDLGSGIRFFADALWARRDGFRKSATATQNLVVPSTNAFFVTPTGVTLPNCPATVTGVPAGTRCATVQYSFFNAYGGPAISDIRSEAYQITGGLDVELSPKWNMNVYVTGGYNHDHVYSVGGAVDAANLAAALRSSDPATAFNPFGTTGGNSASVIAGIFDNLTDTDGKTKFTDFGAKIDGSLFALPGGDVKVAVGVEHNKFWLRTGQVRGRKGAQTGTDQILSRSVKSAYAELLIPIFGPENAVPGFHSLDLDIAGRIDDYSDVGSTRNPKIGVNWHPIEDLKLHASYGTSFRAPLLTNLVSAGGSNLFIQNYFDPTANGGVGATVQGVAVSGGNLNLKPETASTWSFGMEYNPSYLPGAQLSLNYFDLTYEGQIVSYLSNLNVLRQEALFAPIILRGTAAQTMIASLIPGRTINGGSLAQAQAAQVFVEGRPNNQGTTIARGIDFGVSVPFELGNAGKLRLSVRGSRFFTYKVAFTAGGAITEQLNNIDYILKFRGRAALQYETGPFNFNLYANHTNGYNNTFSTLAPKIAANTTVDLSASYDFGDMLGFAKRFQLGVNVTNLFDKAPPFADLAPTNNGGGGFDPTVASPVGRIVSVSLRSKF